MATFYYWLPCDGPTNSAKLLERLRACGLGYAVEDRITSRGSDHGPDAMRGVVICNGPNQDGKLGYWPDQQTWKHVPGTDAWCGMFTADPPKAGDLARKEQVTGEWVQTEDGNAWLAPKARRWFEYEGTLQWALNLPQCLTLGDDGKWMPGGLKAKHKRVWEMARAYESAESRDDGTYAFTTDQLNDLAVASIQVNYRIGAVELDLLGIFDQEFRDRLVNVIIDIDTALEWSKKNEQALAGGSS
jgi:hypothetical protein